MADNKIEKPQFPTGVSGWWKLKMTDLTPEQQTIKRDYYKQYNAWRRSKKPARKRVLPLGVSGWWHKPVAELSEEQLQIKRKYYNQEDMKKYQQEYQQELYNDPERKEKHDEYQREYQRKYQRELYRQDPEIRQKRSVYNKQKTVYAKKYKEIISIN